MQTYYKIPLLPGELLKGKHLKRENLKQSIAGFIHFILISHKGEHRFDPSFGNEMWEEDFKMVGNVEQWKDKITEQLKELLKNKENRLKNIGVHSRIVELEFIKEIDELHQGKAPKRIRKQLEITVEGQLTATSEKVRFEDRIFLSPITYN